MYAQPENKKKNTLNPTKRCTCMLNPTNNVRSTRWNMYAQPEKIRTLNPISNVRSARKTMYAQPDKTRTLSQAQPEKICTVNPTMYAQPEKQCTLNSRKTISAQPHKVFTLNPDKYDTKTVWKTHLYESSSAAMVEGPHQAEILLPKRGTAWYPYSTTRLIHDYSAKKRYIMIPISYHAPNSGLFCQKEVQYP